MITLNRGLWLGATLGMGVFAVACGNLPGSDAGSGCTANSDCSTDQVCQIYDGNECTAKCESAADCSLNFGCDTATGVCFANTVEDAGSDAGTGPMTCDSTASQPDVCGHTNVCTSANECEAVVDGTCSNITSATGRTAFTSSSTGPVIFNVVDETTNDDAFCGGTGTAFTATIYAYAASGSMFGATSLGVTGYYYKTDGSKVALSTVSRPSGYAQLDGGKMASVKVTLCSTTATSTLQAAFAFDNGNGYCTTITH